MLLPTAYDGTPEIDPLVYEMQKQKYYEDCNNKDGHRERILSQVVE